MESHPRILKSCCHFTTSTMQMTVLLVLSEALGEYKNLHLQNKQMNKNKILLVSNQKPLREKVPNSTVENCLAHLDPGPPAGSLAERKHFLGPLISFSSPYYLCDYEANKNSQKHME